MESAPYSGGPEPDLAPSLYLGFRATPGRYFVKCATCEDLVCAYLRQEIHGRHKQSLFFSEESFKIWPSELENQAWILSREWDARRHFGEKQFNIFECAYYLLQK